MRLMLYLLGVAGKILGRGANSCVFRGRLGLRRVIAIKRLDEEDKDSAKAFYRELTIASSLDHPRIVPLVGFCVAPEGLFLVYRYVAGGSLESHLHGTQFVQYPLPTEFLFLTNSCLVLELKNVQSNH